MQGQHPAAPRMENEMRTIKIGYHRFAVPSNWTSKNVGEFAAQMSELTQVSDLSEKVGESWTSVPYLNELDGVTIGHVGFVLPNYESARQHLDGLKDAAEDQRQERDRRGVSNIGSVAT